MRIYGVLGRDTDTTWCSLESSSTRMESSSRQWMESMRRNAIGSGSLESNSENALDSSDIEINLIIKKWKIGTQKQKKTNLNLFI